MTADTPRTLPNSPGHRNLRPGLRWSTLFGLAAAALLFASIYISGAEAATAPTLGAADSYSVLAGSIVTNTGATTMPGDLGISPSIGVAPHYTGFPPGIVGPPGTIHDADADAAAAQAANTAAFGFLDQDCDTTYAGVQDLTLVSPLGSGVYCADAFLLTGNLTLSGSGVWIFKSAATLTTSPGSSVSGGDPCNVWWRLVSSATLDTDTDFVGNILASTSISLGTGASLEGRALTQTGAVTLDDNTFTLSSSCNVTSPSTPTSTAVPGTATRTPPTAPAATSTPSNTPVPSASSSPSPGPTGISTGTITPASPGDIGQPPQAPVIMPPQTGDGGLLQTRGSGIAAAGIGLAAVLLLAGIARSRLRSSRGQAW